MEILCGLWQMHSLLRVLSPKLQNEKSHIIYIPSSTPKYYDCDSQGSTWVTMSLLSHDKRSKSPNNLPEAWKGKVEEFDIMLLLEIPTYHQWRQNLHWEKNNSYKWYAKYKEWLDLHTPLAVNHRIYFLFSTTLYLVFPVLWDSQSDKQDSNGRMAPSHTGCTYYSSPLNLRCTGGCRGNIGINSPVSFSTTCIKFVW